MASTKLRFKLFDKVKIIKAPMLKRLEGTEGIITQLCSVGTKDEHYSVHFDFNNEGTWWFRDDQVELADSCLTGAPTHNIDTAVRQYLCIKNVHPYFTKGATYHIKETTKDSGGFVCEDGDDLGSKEHFMDPEWRDEHFKLVKPKTKAKPKAGGLKYDHAKHRPSLLLTGVPKTLEALVAMLEYGAQKYDAHSWQKVENGVSRYDDAALRHRLQRSAGEERDSESGMYHILHEIMNLMFIAELKIKSGEMTDATSFNEPPAA